MKIIEVVTDVDDAELVAELARSEGLAWWNVSETPETGQVAIRILAGDDKRQKLEDNLQNLLGARENAFATVLPVNAVIPRRDDGEEKEEEKGENGNQRRIGASKLTRAELYQQVEAGATPDGNYILLVILSTIGAAIGMLEDSVAVVIGAMVIAPLLGPNIALALGTTLGDKALIFKALKSSFIGMGIALLISMAIGFLWPPDLEVGELMSRTDVGLASVVLALASGAAAVLSLTSGVSSVLVGVMVAVALLPPTATLGIMLGAGHWSLAWGAFLLLAVNIVCVNLSAKIVFIAKGIKPRTWYEQQAAKKTMPLRVGVWVLSLALLIAVIIERFAVGAK
ncbi:MAG: TIGR00341 family protein [Pseudomonadota bacterium]|nr:TIGR00341 family protein [Pseudomonadota bacterium]